MSVSSEIERLQGLKNDLRTKLVALGLAVSTANLEDCVDAVEGVMNRGAVSGTISTKTGTYSVPAGYHNGSGSVGIANVEKDKIIAANIKSGVTILGVQGSYSGAGVNLQAKTVTPTTSQQAISADAGYDALSSVTVYAIPSNYADITGVDTQGEDVLSGVKFINPNGALKTGTMTNNGAVAAAFDGLTNTSYTIPAGYHSGTGTVGLTNAIETALAAI